jgi:DNA-binding MarR family transcriptional regulator
MVRWDLVSFVSRSEQRKKILSVLSEPITPSEIAKKTGLYSTHVSRTLSEFTKKGLAECLTPKERVGKFYRITRLGKEALKKVNNMKKAILFLVIIACLSLASVALADATWWNPSWQYRISATITENSGKDLTNYQALITIDTQSLISSNKMRSDCGDIRFVADGVEASYWLESGCSSSNTRIWVKVPSILASSTKIIYMYYGNPSASSVSDAINTFELFDDFESGNLSRWDFQNGASVYNDSGNSVLKLESVPGGKDAEISKNPNGKIWSDLEIRLRYKAVSFGDYGPRLGTFLRYINDSYTVVPIDADWSSPRKSIRLSYGDNYWIANDDGSPDWLSVQNVWTDWTFQVWQNNNTTYARWIWKREDSNQKEMNGSYDIASWNGSVRISSWGGNTAFIDNVIVRKYANPEPTISLGPEENDSPKSEGNCTELEKRVGELENRMNVLESLFSSLQNTVLSIQNKLNDFIKMTNFLFYLPQGLRQQMVCDSMVKGNITNKTDLGLHCEINRKKACNCKKVEK